MTKAAISRRSEVDHVRGIGLLLCPNRSRRQISRHIFITPHGNRDIWWDPHTGKACATRAQAAQAVHHG